MGKIEILDKSTINQIAAGEVIERPASVVKELIENAIDAGSTAVTCEIAEGGIKLIRITDNGCGIDRDEVRTAFIRHSTSKIRTAADLQTINSLGFRGEALASIAAVSEVEIITKTRTSFTGTRLVLSSGEEKVFEEIGCPDGTTFIVRNLFFNVPARKKFLKSELTEAGYVSDLMERMAISHPEVSFKYINNNKTLIYTTGNKNLKEIIYNVYGRDVAAQLVNVNYCNDEGISIEGFIAKPIVSRGNRNLENYYVNGRYIKSSVITKAIEEAYKTYMMQHKYPFTALHLIIAKETMDVNVHPTKMDVRFENSEKVYLAVFNAIHKTLAEKSLIQTSALNGIMERKNKEIYTEVPEPFEENRKKTEFILPVLHNTEEKNISIIREERVNYINDKLDEKEKENKISCDTRQYVFDTSHPGKEVEPIYRAETIKEFKLGLQDGYKIIGQLFNTYWLVERGEEFYIIDQHAAHEKILYEKMVDSLNKNCIISQNISPPIVITLSLSEASLIENNKQILLNAGFEIEPFGGRDYAISSVPSEIYGLESKDFFTELIASLNEQKSNATPKLINERLASMSCKAAVKGNTKMSQEEAKALIENLLELENPFHCPHGRPIIISMDKCELERKFKRLL